ncbi:response regulator [Lyngbya sp. CCY1209]|jgi:two-component system chemotaxis response regulator CheY|uniref:response regulator n=1 Tax=Lyngbya sp. CCY1209 TaxID=2886103 RepID=UPI002D20BD84|nr:response regulator [Lyngbya sp. CCY1209]MEB3885089.1 response regulator [Lyngbya sp. CCY1209]
MAKILIVDDSSLSRKIMRSILETEGHEVLEANGGLAALERYFIDHPDLVLIDLAMPDMQGTEVLTKLREMDEKARVIIASADAQDLTQRAVKAAGALGYITKPFAPEAVLEQVNQVLVTGPQL